LWSQGCYGLFINNNGQHMQSTHQQVGGTRAFRAARAVPLVVVGHLQGQYLKQRATLYMVG